MPANLASWACAVEGLLVMYLTMMFVVRFLKTDSNAKPKYLAAFLAIPLGGTAVGFATAQLGAGKEEMAWYAIGLGVGFGLYVIAYTITTGKPPTRRWWV